MRLNLDKRQRAMLLEMGVRVWQPSQAAPPMSVASQVQQISVTAAPALQASDVAAANTSHSHADTSASLAQPSVIGTGEAAAWQIGQVHHLYSAGTDVAAPRWLVLTETPASAFQASWHPFDGEAGKLLDNMLRAARLDQSGAVALAPMSRHAQTDASLATALPQLLSRTRPDLVLVMGRLATQALLQSHEVFGKLRGRLHSLQGVKVIVMHDVPYLLRNPLDKAKAWEDLCLAVRVAAAS